MNSRSGDSRNPVDSHGSVQLTLRIIGPDLDPDDVTRLLRLQPTHTHRRGDSRPELRYAPYSHGLWGLESNVDPGASLDQHLDGMIRLLRGREDELQEIHRRGYDVDLFAGVFVDYGNVEVWICPERLASLGELGVALGLDVYLGKDDEPAEGSPASARVAGGELLSSTGGFWSPAEAVREIRAAAAEGLAVLGVEGFDYEPVAATLTSRLDLMADFSRREWANWEEHRASCNGFALGFLSALGTQEGVDQRIRVSVSFIDRSGWEEAGGRT